MGAREMNRKSEKGDDSPPKEVKAPVAQAAVPNSTRNANGSRLPAATV
jgi:hypothetical protein